MPHWAPYFRQRGTYWLLLLDADRVGDRAQELRAQFRCFFTHSIANLAKVNLLTRPCEQITYLPRSNSRYSSLS
jgi:hypothetical protein